jgi:hypothetical protein
LRTATKKIISVLFIVLGLTPLLFTLAFTIKQQSIRHRMKERMEIQALHSITLADNEIRWAKEGKEIWVNGKMFDIKRSDHKNGLTTFYGLYDEDETLLKIVFNNGWKKKMTEQNQLLSQFFQSLQGICFTPITDSPVLPSKQYHTASLHSPKPQSQFKTILTPPPQA